MRNGKGRRDERIRDLREKGLSLRAIGRKVGLSGMQVSRILDATETPAEEFLHPLSVLLDDMADAGPCSHWTREQQAAAYRAKLRHCTDPEERELIRYRLRFVAGPGE